MTTTTIQLTGADRHRLLADLWAVTGLGEHIVWMTVDGRGPEESFVYLDQDAHVAPLAIAHGLLDDRRVWATRSYDGRPVSRPAVYVSGSYRGVPVTFAFEELLPSQEAAEAALADLLSAVDQTGGAS